MKNSTCQKQKYSSNYKDTLLKSQFKKKEGGKRTRKAAGGKERTWIETQIIRKIIKIIFSKI